MVATVVVVMVVVMVFFIVVAIVATVSKPLLVIHVNHTNARVARVAVQNTQADAQIARADVQTATVVVVLSSLKKLLPQKQLLKRPRRIRKRKLQQLQLKPNIGFTQQV